MAHLAWLHLSSVPNRTRVFSYAEGANTRSLHPLWCRRVRAGLCRRPARGPPEAFPVGSHLSGLRADKARGSWLGSPLIRSSRLRIRRWPVPSPRPARLRELPQPPSGPTGPAGEGSAGVQAAPARGTRAGSGVLCRGQSPSPSDRPTCGAFVSDSTVAAEVLAGGGR